jgi:hypothetical protein
MTIDFYPLHTTLFAARQKPHGKTALRFPISTRILAAARFFDIGVDYSPSDQPAPLLDNRRIYRRRVRGMRFGVRGIFSISRLELFPAAGTPPHSAA